MNHTCRRRLLLIDADTTIEHPRSLGCERNFAFDVIAAST